MIPPARCPALAPPDPRPAAPAEYDERFACFGSADFRIGYRSFLAQSKPDFRRK